MNACPGCGARLAPGATRCDLCGTSVHEPDPTPLQAEEPEPAAPASVPAEPADRRFCSECGAESSARARFCWQCGTPLAEGAEAPPPPGSPAPVRPAVAGGAPSASGHPAAPDAAGRRALVLLGVSALVVVALFALMQRGGGPAPLTPPPGATAGADAGVDSPPPPLPPDVAARVANLEDALAAAQTPEERFELRRDLIETLLRAGAFAQAGSIQQALAEATGDPLAWADAGSFYLAHMLRAEGAEREEYARRSARAYERALEADPTDLDVKTDLATAYLNDPANPMRAVEVVREVLEADPDHARARFNYGLMLAQIGRGDQAREQFERVLALTPADDLVHERAREEIERLSVMAPAG